MKLPSDGVFVIWEWSWVSPDHMSDESSGSSTASLSSKSSDNEPVQNPACLHTITFKCIGSVKNLAYQNALAQVSKYLSKGETVPVKLLPEPLNPVDTQAVAFVCELNGEWKPIGYVVREALDNVNEGLKKKLIVETKFNWVKYITSWKRSGPGWYAGIDITVKGRWSASVRNSASRQY